MNPFDVFLTTPILNLLIAFYKVFEFLPLPGALSFAIIFLTISIRLLLWPLTTAQLKSSQKMAQLKPHLDRIKKEHGQDKTRHQQEVGKLYKEHGVNPLAGCLPLLLQIPVFIALYNVLLKIVQFDGDFIAGINQKLYYKFLYLDKLPSVSFLGFKLSDKPNGWQEIGFLILMVPLITGLLQFVQSKMITPDSPKKAETESKKESLEDSMSQVQSQMVFIMPLMIAFFSYGFPLGLSLYWNTFTVVGIVQQYIISGPGSLGKYLPKNFKGKSQNG